MIFGSAWVRQSSTRVHYPTSDGGRWPSLRNYWSSTQCIYQNNAVFLLLIGVYVTSPGPRFETSAESRFLSTVGDVVGMTGERVCRLVGRDD